MGMCLDTLVLAIGIRVWIHVSVLKSVVRSKRLQPPKR